MSTHVVHWGDWIVSESRTNGCSMTVTTSAYERITAKRNATRRLPCRRNHDGTHCVLEPLHDDWHADSHGRRWP